MKTGQFNTIMAQAAQLFNGSFDGNKTIKIGKNSFDVLQKNGYFIINKNNRQQKGKVAEHDLPNVLVELLQEEEMSKLPLHEWTEFSDNNKKSLTGILETPAEAPEQTATETPTETPTEAPEQTATETPTETPEQTATETPAVFKLISEMSQKLDNLANEVQKKQERIDKFMSKGLDGLLKDLENQKEELQAETLILDKLQEDKQILKDTIKMLTSVNAEKTAAISISYTGNFNDGNNIDIQHYGIVKTAIDSCLALVQGKIETSKAKISFLSMPLL